MTALVLAALLLTGARPAVGSAAVAGCAIPPLVTSQPQGTSVRQGETASFTASASTPPGCSAPAAQWQISTNGGNTWANDVADVGGRTRTLTITAAALSQSGYEYRVQFTNEAGTVNSQSAALTVTNAYSASLTLSCVLGPGAQNVAGPVAETVTANGPASVAPGDGVSLTGASVTLTLPAQWSAVFAGAGAATVSGSLTNLVFDVSNGQPATFNTAGAGVSLGPIAVVSGTPLVLSSSGLSVGPLIVTGSTGNTLALTEGATPGYTQSGDTYTATGNGVVANLAGSTASGAIVSGPLSIACNAPSPPVVLAAIPIAAANPSPLAKVAADLSALISLETSGVAQDQVMLSQLVAQLPQVSPSLGTNVWTLPPVSFVQAGLDAAFAALNTGLQILVGEAQDKISELVQDIALNLIYGPDLADLLGPLASAVSDETSAAQSDAEAAKDLQDVFDGSAGAPGSESYDQALDQASADTASATQDVFDKFSSLLRGLQQVAQADTNEQLVIVIVVEEDILTAYKAQLATAKRPLELIPGGIIILPTPTLNVPNIPAGDDIALPDPGAYTNGVLNNTSYDPLGIPSGATVGSTLLPPATSSASGLAGTSLTASVPPGDLAASSPVALKLGNQPWQYGTTLTNGSASFNEPISQGVAPGSYALVLAGQAPSLTGLLPAARSLALAETAPGSGLRVFATSFSVIGQQSISFTSTPPPNQVVGDSYQVAATGGQSGNPVTFSVDGSSTSVCSLSGTSSVTFTQPGNCVIDANQAGSQYYLPAPQAQQTVPVGGSLTSSTSTTASGPSGSSSTTTSTTSSTSSTPSGGVGSVHKVVAPSAQPASVCGKVTVDLLDAYLAGGRLRLLGYANPRLAGRAVVIMSTWNKKTVAQTKVATNGYFNATASPPAASRRLSNSTRYQASISKQHSPALKLTRRLYVFAVTNIANRQVRITGQIVKPLAAPPAKIVVTLRDSCQSNYVRLKTTTKLDRVTGAFTIVAPAPPADAPGAVYRLQTRISDTVSNHKTFATASLPRVVNG